eukprot:gnl/Trimastix_PCT/628.p1 GENE.gnl/Trimastix_PCT/628~~gnl/Trimastix_PCT/628.p1  ORF type:complete len:515 (-),score=115.72 gnl/Trimastix_PCT/628:655-2199(-)
MMAPQKLILLSVFLVVCMASSDFIQWRKYPTILELSARPWLYELSQKYGYQIKLADVPDEVLEEYSRLGYKALYLMGVWHLGPAGLRHDRTDPGLLHSYSVVLPGYTQEDIIGSPYAITHYTCNPNVGTDSDLRNFRARLHALGLKLILDFVPNHTAVDSPWTTEHPEYYIRAPPSVQPPYDPQRYMPSGIAYGRDPYSGAWTDTAQLNYWSAEAREAMTQALLTVASFSDGVRCDMAMLMLNDVFQRTWGPELSGRHIERPATEFWPGAVDRVKAAHPGYIFMAEVYWGLESKLRSLGFDFTYDKDGLYNRLVAKHLDNLRGYIAHTDFSGMTHFTANHDEPRAVSALGGIPQANTATALAMTLPGMRFYWMGQRDGKANKLDVHLRRSAPEPSHPEVRAFYQTLLNITRHEVFHTGAWRYLDMIGTDDGSAWRLMGWAWLRGDDKRLVVVNYSDEIGAGRVRVPEAWPRHGADVIDITDLISGQRYRRSAREMREEGLTVVLSPWTVQIFEY